MIKRDLDLAVVQIMATIRRQLPEIEGLTTEHVLDLARTIAACIDEYGRIKEEDGS